MKAKFFADMTYTPRITEHDESSPQVSLAESGEVKLSFRLRMDGRPYAGGLTLTIREFEHMIADYNAMKLEGLADLKKALAGLK
jgi:hypothetical protein